METTGFAEFFVDPVYKLTNGEKKIPILEDLIRSLSFNENDSVSYKRDKICARLEEIYAEDVKPRYLAETVMEAKHLQVPYLEQLKKTLLLKDIL